MMSREMSLGKCSSNSAASCSGGTRASRGELFAARIIANVTGSTASPTVIAGVSRPISAANSGSLRQARTTGSASARPASKISAAPAARRASSRLASAAIADASAFTTSIRFFRPSQDERGTQRQRQNYGHNQQRGVDRYMQPRLGNHLPADEQ